MKATAKEKEEATTDLKRWLPKGSKVYTILRHVSSSGMTRHISVVVFVDGAPLHPNYSVAKVLGRRLTTTKGQDAVIETGCGMDMGFHLVNSLAIALYGDGQALKQEWL